MKVTRQKASCQRNWFVREKFDEFGAEMVDKESFIEALHATYQDAAMLQLITIDPIEKLVLSLLLVRYEGTEIGNLARMEIDKW